MNRRLTSITLVLALASPASLPVPAAAAGPDREESELPMALRPSGSAAWERWLETRRCRFGVPVDCDGATCAGSAESPGGAPSRDRPAPNDRGRGSEKP